jgi:uncharacterized protein YprB with RNaseH-like and TPR domain
MNRKDLRRRLREMGVVQGVRELATLPQRRRVAIQDLVEGRFRTTAHGRCFVAEATYPSDHNHGNLPLSSFFNLSPEILAQLGREDTLAHVDLRQMCFLDTETTGLSGGAGTMAFVVGVGFFADDAGAAASEDASPSADAGDVFHLHQYFLRDPGDEPAMIEDLAARLSSLEALVSFNGRAFDVPILENRFILGRIPPPTSRMPHLDLLQPARRLWQYHLSSCRLGSLEQEVLGVRREQDDVPSGEIPYLYRDYLRTGDAREMQRVLYHNAIDILSLVTLAARLCRAFADPWTDPALSGAEFYGLGRWYAAEGRLAETERAYRTALAKSDLASETRTRGLRDLARLLKRADRRAEAFAYWQQLALETADVPSGDVPSGDAPSRDATLAHVELAKHFEWHEKNLALAAGWTRAALARVESWPAGLLRDDTLAELRHRLARLERKAGSPGEPGDA